MGDDGLYPTFDQQIPRYSPQSRVSGTVKIVGSNMMKTIFGNMKNPTGECSHDLKIILETGGQYGNRTVNSVEGRELRRRHAGCVIQKLRVLPSGQVSTGFSPRCRGCVCCVRAQ